MDQGCDCYARATYPARSALAALVARIEELERDDVAAARAHGREWDDARLPTTRDMIGLVPDMTGGLSAEEYVRRLRS